MDHRTLEYRVCATGLNKSVPIGLRGLDDRRRPDIYTLVSPGIAAGGSCAEMDVFNRPYRTTI